MIDMDNIPVAGYDSVELLQIADAIAREKAIEADEVLIAMEMAIQKAARTKYGQDTTFASSSTGKPEISISPDIWR